MASFSADTMPATAEDAANASQEWLLAQKIRRALQQDIDRVKKCAADGSELELFKKLDEWIAQYVFSPLPGFT